MWNWWCKKCRHLLSRISLIVNRPTYWVIDLYYHLLFISNAVANGLFTSFTKYDKKDSRLEWVKGWGAVEEKEWGGCKLLTPILSACRSWPLPGFVQLSAGIINWQTFAWLPISAERKSACEGSLYERRVERYCKLSSRSFQTLGLCSAFFLFTTLDLPCQAIHYSPWRMLGGRLFCFQRCSQMRSL